MCGIVGIYSTKKNYSNNDLTLMLKEISHRGPDDSGIKLFLSSDNYKESLSEGNLAFGHKRLSILDLSKLGHQPMTNNKKDFWITFNGEIFNFQDIRETLIKKGYLFESNTDTEVILYSYIEYGEKCLDLFRGFFAFCIFDIKKQELFLARDRLGSKPLKYYYDGETFAFCSELKSFYPIKEIKKVVSLDSISDYLSLKYIPSPKTIFRDIKKLSAGHFLKFSLRNNNYEIKKYWSPIFEPKEKINYDDAKIKTKEILSDSINIRMISDVPVGIFLSGGIDSSSIVALLREKEEGEINTFSVGFNDSKFDERVYASKIAKIFKTNHTEFLVEPNLENDLEMIVNNYDEPFADPSMIPTYYLANKVSKYVKVVLGGDGADEMLSGYKRYNIHKRNSFLNYFPNSFYNLNNKFLSQMELNLNKSKGVGKLARISESLSGNLIDTYYLRLTGFSKKQKFDLFKKDFKQLNNKVWNDEIYDYFKEHPNLNNLDSLMAIDQITHLPEYILTKSDISGMANSIEARAPFIDVKFIDWINKLDISFKNKGYSKRILKDILEETGVPKDIIHRKKAGFTPPLNNWMRELDSLVKKYILESDLLDFFDKEIRKKIYDYNIISNYNFSNHVWILLVLAIWLDKNKDFIEIES
jgi:asparagine synthase (glutamine-hydrolysing)